MYNIDDKRKVVFEIQKFLHIISDRSDGVIPRVSADGVYNKQTEEAVIVFQRENGIPETGAVDYNTYTAIFDAYTEIMISEGASEYIISNEDFPFSIGRQNEDIYVLHTMINELGSVYPTLPKLDKTNYYSKKTSDAVKMLEEIYLFEISGEVDAVLFDRMNEDIRHSRLAFEEYI